jgi:hypothetical protein
MAWRRLCELQIHIDSSTGVGEIEGHKMDRQQRRRHEHGTSQGTIAGHGVDGAKR